MQSLQQLHTQTEIPSLMAAARGPGVQAQLLLLSQMWQLQHVLVNQREWEGSGKFALRGHGCPDMPVTLS